MAAIMDGGKLRLSGSVGDYYFDDGFTYDDVVYVLAAVEDDADLDVYINSPGGVATEGAAIHALLRARSGKNNVVVEGIAASAASLIAMAGDTVTMALGSIMMIHDPSGFAWGTSTEVSKTVDQLEALATSYARVYASKSGKTPAECREIMKNEVWLTPDEAVADGFADATGEVRAVAVAAFDYRKFQHAPNKLVALAKTKNWAFPAQMKAAPPAPPRQSQEPSMTDKTTGGGDDAAELARLRAENTTMKTEKDDRTRRDAIMALPEADGRTDQAKALCDTPGITADQAKAIMAASPKAAAVDDEDDQDTPDPAAYARTRATAAGLEGGKAPKGKGDKSILAAAVARTNKRR